MKTMTPRQRVVTALTRRVPDRVPKHAWFTPFQLQQVRERTGCDDPAEAFGFECRFVSFRPLREKPDFSRYLPPDLPPGTTSDEWGLTEKPGTFYHFTEYVYPMANLTSADQLDDWPSPTILHPIRSVLDRRERMYNEWSGHDQEGARQEGDQPPAARLRAVGHRYHLACAGRVSPLLG